MRGKLLFIDDEPFFARAYLERFAADTEVIVITNVDDALRYIDSTPDIGAIVLDVMMPMSRSAEMDAVFAHDAGLLLLERIRDRVEEQRIPIVVLSNYAGHDVEHRVEAMGFHRAEVTVRSKLDTPPSHLLPLLNRMEGGQGDE